MARSFAASLVLLLAACASDDREPGEPRVPSPEEELRCSRIGAALREQGLASERESLHVIELGSEGGLSLYLTPGIPGPDERIVLVAAGELADSVKSARVKLAGSASPPDAVPGTALTLEGRQAFLFELAPPKKDGEASAVVCFTGAEGESCSAEGRRFRVLEPAELTWIGRVSASQGGVIRLPNEDLFAHHDLTVSVETWPLSPGVEARLRYATDPQAEATHVPMRLVTASAGVQGENALWRATIPTSTLPTGSHLVYWLEAHGPENAVAERQHGLDYWTAISLDPPAPVWAEVGHCSGTGGLAYESGLPEPWSVLDGPRVVVVEVHVPGVTDQPVGPHAVADSFVRVEVVSALLALGDRPPLAVRGVERRQLAIPLGRRGCGGAGVRGRVSLPLPYLHRRRRDVAPARLLGAGGGRGADAPLAFAEFVKPANRGNSWNPPPPLIGQVDGSGSRARGESAKVEQWR